MCLYVPHGGGIGGAGFIGAALGTTGCPVRAPDNHGPYLQPRQLCVHLRVEQLRKRRSRVGIVTCLTARHQPVGIALVVWGGSQGI